MSETETTGREPAAEPVVEPVAPEAPAVDAATAVEPPPPPSGEPGAEPPMVLDSTPAPSPVEPPMVLESTPAPADRAFPRDEPAAAKPADLTLRIGGATDVGRIRDHNEDNFVLADLTREKRGGDEVGETVRVGARGMLLAVCDGMGGALAGEIASQMAVDVIHTIMQESSSPDDADEFAQTLVTAVQEAGARIFLAAKTNRNQHGMGTTSTVAGVFGSTLFVGQVGDSRAYLFRAGRLRQITKDQSLVSKLIEAGRLTEEQAESYEHAHIILQALGTADAVSVDLSFIDLRRGDALLLCSDGLSGLATHEQIHDALATIDDPTECCQRLIDAANEAGGHDNITVVVARFEGDLPPPSTDDEPVGYHAFVLSESVESPIVGSASSALKVPALPPPGSDVKKAHSYPPGREERARVNPEVAAASSGRAPDDEGEAPVLPVSSGGAWVGWLLAALAVALLAFGAWKLFGASRPPAPTPPPAALVEDAPPVTPVTPNGGAAPTLVPAPSWGDAAEAATPDAAARD
jgi:protein phosphatase